MWLHLVACLARNKAVTTIQNHQTKVHNMPLAKTVNLEYTPLNIISRKGTVTLLHSSHFQVLCSFITSLHSTSHTVRNLPAAQAKDMQVMGHHGKDMTCTKVVIVGLKCSPHRSSQDKGPSSPGEPRVPPGLPGNHPVNQPTTSSSTSPPQPPSGAPGRHPIHLPTKRFQPPAEQWKTDVAGIADLPPLPEMFYDGYDAADESHNSSDLGGAEGKPPISLKQMEFSLKQFAKRMGQPNFSAFNKWKKVWVVGFFKKKHQSIIRGQYRLKQVRDGPLHWEMAVADFLATFDTWLPLINFNNAEWIRRQWVEMFLNKCASEIWEMRKKGRRGNKQPATDLGERVGKKARSNLPELPNTTFTVMIH